MPSFVRPSARARQSPVYDMKRGSFCLLIRACLNAESASLVLFLFSRKRPALKYSSASRSLGSPSLQRSSFLSAMSYRLVVYGNELRYLLAPDQVTVILAPPHRGVPLSRDHDLGRP